MNTWSESDLAAIGDAEELHIEPQLSDGTTDAALPIWVVRIGNDLYVRAYRGTTGHWYRRIMSTGRAAVSAGGVVAHATFTVPDDAPTAAIDAVYRAKYGHYAESIVGPMVQPSAQAATLRLTPSLKSERSHHD